MNRVDGMNALIAVFHDDTSGAKCRIAKTMITF